MALPYMCILKHRGIDIPAHLLQFLAKRRKAVGAVLVVLATERMLFLGVSYCALSLATPGLRRFLRIFHIVSISLGVKEREPSAQLT